MPKQITVQEIESKTHKYWEFINLSFYISDIITKELLTLEHITVKVYLVDDLQTKLFININIIESEWISTDILSKKTILKSYQNTLIDLQITSKNNN